MTIFSILNQRLKTITLRSTEPNHMRVISTTTMSMPYLRPILLHLAGSTSMIQKVLFVISKQILLMTALS
jgi:hypothetical protein